MKKTIQKKSEEFIKLCEQYGVDPDNVPEITSVEAAYAARGYDFEKARLDLSGFPERHRGALQNTGDMFVVHEAMNADQETGELYEPNWNEGDERKWTNWWDMEVDDNNPSGFRFHDSDYDDVSTRSTGGSRLCSRNPDIQNFIAKHFTPQFRKMMVFEK